MRRGSVSLRPRNAASIGARNSSAHTTDDTGLPGRPSSGVRPSVPNIRGLPGRIAIFQKSSASPDSPSALWTRSCSPTEAPPVVTSRSAPRADSAMVRSVALSSGAMPILTGSPPLAATKAASAQALELTIWPGARGSPGCTISSPVARMAIRGRRRTVSHGTFIAAHNPMSRGVSTRPAANSASPMAKSSPARRT